MAFVRTTASTRKGLPAKIAKRASIVMDVGDVLIQTSGQADVAVGSSVVLLGLAVKKVAATDSDYASTTAIEIEQIEPGATYIADVSTGTATVANIGIQYDLDDKNSITLSGTTYKQVKVVGVLSTTQVLVQFNPSMI